ncbi:type II toxin-antitoxin system HicA family toxin [Candidatus Binatia bacterium]|nr:type II toxin-antitoxin system HicA family toxin [Candidatus Binatia bacterium]
MSKLPGVSSDQVARALRRAGFVYAPKRGKGSHMAFYKLDAAGKVRLVIVPKRKELPHGTLRAIIEQAGLTTAEFIDLL